MTSSQRRPVSAGLVGRVVGQTPPGNPPSLVVGHDSLTGFKAPIPDWQSLAPRQCGTQRVDQVHVWSARLNAAPAARDHLFGALAPSERERSRRYHFDLHRHRFITGRGVLRALLGGYLKVEPRLLEFANGPYGKPALKGAFAQSGIHFNLSHSEDLALLAVTQAGPVGVDIEKVREVKDSADLVARFFSKREGALFEQIPAEEKALAFFNLWTRKEALLKATGEGIGRWLNRVEVSFMPHESARLLSLPKVLGRPADWSLHAFNPVPGFIGALAIAANNIELHYWFCPDSPR